MSESKYMNLLKFLEDVRVEMKSGLLTIRFNEGGIQHGSFEQDVL